ASSGTVGPDGKWETVREAPITPENPATLTVVWPEPRTWRGLALLGNGKFYGGPFDIFPGADLRNGRLEVCVFPRVNAGSLLRLAPGFLTRRKLSEHRVQRLRATKIELASNLPAAFELDGEWIGRLPATFTVEQERLCVVIP
ncbi:MAG: hypothetical protein WCJ07_15365, partial [Verrucomicrobiota bacterium]